MPLSHHERNQQPYHTDRSLLGLTRTAPSTKHQDGGIKHATGASSKILLHDNSTIGTWNTRALRAAGKLQELTQKMDRYRRNNLGLCEMRWKNFVPAKKKKPQKKAVKGQLKCVFEYSWGLEGVGRHTIKKIQRLEFP